MSDFNSWEEVKDWLEDPEDNYQTVTYHCWTFSKSYMSCWDDGEYGPCCQDDFKTVEEVIESIQNHTDKLELVEKND